MSETQTSDETVTHEVTIEAPIEDIWEALSTEAGRDIWLEPDEDRTLVVEERQAPNRITWWWWHESDTDEPARHVEVRVAAVPDVGTRVTVTETRPALVPVASLASKLEMVCA
jgi:uncharacterized protein YndB with AHSA1/START domain